MRDVFRKMFLSYILISVLPLLVFGLACYFWVSDMVGTQARQYYQSSVNEARASIDNRFNELYSFAIQLSQTPWVLNISNMNGPTIDYSRIDPIELSDHVHELMGYTSINNSIKSVVIAFPEKNTVVSSIGIADMKSFWDEIYKLDGLDSRWWEDIISTYNISPVIKHSSFTSASDSNSKTTIYIQSLPTLDQKSRAVLIVFINDNVLTSILKGFQTADSSSLYIMDGGAVVSSINIDEATCKLISEKENENKTHAYSRIKLKDIDYFSFRALSQVNKWEYNIIVPVHTVLYKADYIKIITIIVVFIFTLMGFAISYWMTIRNYNPLSKLIKLVKGSQTIEDGVEFNNEYNFLETSLSSLLKAEEDLKRKTVRELPLIRNAYLMKLLDNSINVDKKLSDILDSMNVKFDLPYFQVILFHLRILNGINDNVQRKFTENFNNPGINIYFVEIDGRKKAIIINFAEGKCDRNILKNLKHTIEENLQVTCVAGAGSLYGNMEGIPDSYREAQKAIDYRLIKDQIDIMFFEDIEENNKTNYYFPFAKESSILNELRTGKYDAAMNIIDNIINVNTSNVHINLTTARCLFYDLMGTAFKALNELPINSTLKVDYDRITDLESISDMRKYLRDICKEICSLIQNNKKSHNEILKESIKLYIDDKYTMQNLSLSMVADAMSISASYLSKFFKEQFGENFLDYMHKKRIEMAKTLLSGQFTISQIAAMTGYNSDETFRRAFKNYAGITPGEYKNKPYIDATSA